MAIPAALLVALALLAGYIGYLILQRTLSAWLRPLLQWIFAPRQSFWKRVLLWPVRGIGHGLQAVEKYVARILGGAFYLAGATLARFFHALGWTEELLTLGMQRMFEAIWTGMVYLREVAIPKLVSAIIKPWTDKTTNALALATAATTALTGISVEFANGLRALPWGVPLGLPARVAAFFNAFETLWDKVWKNLAPRLDVLEHTTVPKIANRVGDIEDDLYHSGQGSLARIRQRLGQLEGKIGNIGTAEWWQAGVQLGIATLVGLTAAAVSVGLRALFCRNNLGLARNVCAAPGSYIDEVLAVIFAVEAIENLPTLVRIMQGVTHETATTLQDLAEV